MKIKRGDIYIVDLGEGFGSEQGGIRLHSLSKTT